jgi:hypothetical protein
MKCEVCGGDFTAQRKTKRFCSDRCRIKNHRPSMAAKYNSLWRDYNALLVRDYNAPSAQDENDEDREDRRLREIQEINEETRQAKLYASLFYIPAREISHMLDDGETAENIVRVMRRRRYVLKVDVTPMELKKAGEMFLRLARQETR